MELIDKAAVVAEIKRRINNLDKLGNRLFIRTDFPEQYRLISGYESILSFLDTLEVIDPYKRCVQHQSVMDAIRAHAETYSFNVNSELFPQLTKEQQKLWRKEIEYACISGGDMGYILAKDLRYKENHEVKEMNLEKKLKEFLRQYYNYDYPKQYQDGTGSDKMPHIVETAKYFFNLGLNAQKGEKV